MVTVIISKFKHNVLALISLIKNEIAKSIYLICRSLPELKWAWVEKVYIFIMLTRHNSMLGVF